MTYDARLAGNIKWVCDECGTTTTTKQVSHGTNMRKFDMNFNVNMPPGWRSWVDEYGASHVCDKCSKEK